MKKWTVIMGCLLAAVAAMAQQKFDSAAYVRYYTSLFPGFAIDTVTRRENLTDEEKIEGLSRVWSEARFNFSNFDLIPHMNWDSVYRNFIPKVIATKDTRAYYSVLQQFNQHLRDGHSSIVEPPAFFTENNAGIPIRFLWIDNSVVLAEIMTDDPEYRQLQKGWVLETINGEAVQQYIRREISPYLYFSTPQDSISRIYTYELLKGKAGSTVSLGFRDNNNASINMVCTRTKWYTKLQPAAFHVLPDNTGYIRINTFATDQVVQFVDSIFPRLQQTRALIIDIRTNGGGNSNNGFELIGYLTSKPFFTGMAVQRSYRPTQRAWGNEPIVLQVDRYDWKPYKNKLYGKPVVLLTSACTYSAAEDFTAVFKANHIGTVIGAPTGGSTGQPLGYNLPGGGIGFVCTKRDAFPGGEEFVGKGIRPDIIVATTLQGLKSGRDETIEAALVFINSQLTQP